jgi:hypothetical protein
MSNGTQTTVHFVCAHCGLPYQATQQQSTEQLSGSFDCEECHKPVHEWTGFYDLFNWGTTRIVPVREEGTKP